MELIKKHWGFLAGLLFVCAVAYASGYTGDFVRLRPGALPSAGSDGELRVDSGDSNKLKKYSVTNSAWEEISGSGGGSGINYFSDFQADTIGNVSEFDDTSAIVDGTGGSPANLATASETSNPLSGDASYKLSKDTGANAQYEGFSVLTDTPDRTSVVGGETVYVTFNYETSANYDNDASGEQVSIYVYRVGSNTLESCNTRDVLSGSFTNALPVAPDGGQYQCVTTLESTDTAVRVIFGITGTGTSTWDIVVDKIKVGPDAVVTAPIVTETQSYTPTWTGGSPSIGNGTLSGTYKIIGDTLYGTVYLLAGSTTTFGSGQWEFSLPAGYTIDTTKLNNSNSVQSSYVAYANDQTGSIAVGTVQLNSSNDTVYIWSQGGTSSWRSTVPFSWANTDYLSFSYEVPIEQSSGNAILSTTQADFSTSLVTAQKTSGAHGTSGSWLDVSFTELTDDLGVFDGTTFTAPYTGTFLFTGSAGLDTMTGSMGARLVNGSGTLVAGLAFQYTSSSATQASFSKTLELTKGDEVKLQVYQTSGGSVNYLVNTRDTSLEIKAQPDFSTFSTYGPYEYTEALVSSVPATVSATTYVDAAGGSISLTPGTWQLCHEGNHYMQWSSGAIGAICKTVIRDGSNNEVSGTEDLAYLVLDGTYNGGLTSYSKCAEVTITETTTYKMSVQAAAGSANYTCGIFRGNFTGGITDQDTEAKIWARRMK